MKSSFLIPAALLASFHAANAATIINLTNIRPDPATGAVLLGDSTFGGTLSATTAGIPVINSTTAGSTLNSASYPITISNLDLSSIYAGATNVTISFNLNLTASAGDGLGVNGATTKTWIVDDSVVANTGTTLDSIRLNAGETITYTVSGLSFSGTSGTISGVSFDGFTGGFFNPNSGTFNTSTGVATGAGAYTASPDAATRLVSIGVDLSVVPEPSTALLSGFGLLALLRRRR